MYLIPHAEPTGKRLEPAAYPPTPRERRRANLGLNHRRALILLEELGLKPTPGLELSSSYLDPVYARDGHFYILISATEIRVGLVDGYSYSTDRAPELSSERGTCDAGPLTIHLRSQRPDRPRSRVPPSDSITGPIHAFLVPPKIHQMPTGHLHRFPPGAETPGTQLESPWLIDLLGDPQGSSHIEPLTIHHWRIRDIF